jgi:hypothetical protein
MNFSLFPVKHHSPIAYGAVKRRLSLILISGACWRQVAIFIKRLFHDKGNILLETLTRKLAQPKSQYRPFGKEKNVLLCWNQTQLLPRYIRTVFAASATQNLLHAHSTKIEYINSTNQHNVAGLDVQQTSVSTRYCLLRMEETRCSASNKHLPFLLLNTQEMQFKSLFQEINKCPPSCAHYSYYSPILSAHSQRTLVRNDLFS